MILGLLALTLMVADHRYHHLETLRSNLTIIVDPLRNIVNMPYIVGNWISETFSTRKALFDQNDSLKSENLLLRAQLQRLAALQSENRRLRKLMQSSSKVGERLLIAELLQVNLEPFTRQIVINKGTSNDVYNGQPLLDADGVVGQIIHASRFSSTALLITDPSHALPVQVNRNGLRAVAIGSQIPNQLHLVHVPNNADIKIGDLLVTSGLGGRFPPGYPVASVTQLLTDPSEPFADVIAEPSAKLQRSREVLLVWPDLTDANKTEKADDGR